MINTRENDMQSKDRLRDQAASAFREGEKELKDVVGEVEKSLKKKIIEGKETIQQVASTLDKQIHANPWPIVTGVAASCLLLGFIVGTSRRGA